MTDSALFQLGMDLHGPSTSQAEGTFDADTTHARAANENDIETFFNDDGRLDHFIEKDGVRCAGQHLIIDLYDAEGLNNASRIRNAMLECVEKAGATLLHIHLHNFEPNGGISGVAVLAESHISVHTWPECNYAAFDVFMCGKATPEICTEILQRAFNAGRVEVGNHLRGKEVVEQLSVQN